MTRVIQATAGVATAIANQAWAVGLSPPMPQVAFVTVGLARPGEAEGCWRGFREPIRGSPVMSHAPAGYGYHAHVYYDAATLPVAEQLKEELGARFDVELGPNSGERVGPHPVPQFQMIFKKELFETVVPWLMLNREGLDILIHPLTDDMVDDHGIRVVARYAGQACARYDAAPGISRGVVAESGLTEPARE